MAIRNSSSSVIILLNHVLVIQVEHYRYEQKTRNVVGYHNIMWKVKREINEVI